MAFRTTGPARRPGNPIVLPRWSRYVIPVLAALIALIVIVAVGAGVWTDWLWFRSVQLHVGIRHHVRRQVGAVRASPPSS